MQPHFGGLAFCQVFRGALIKEALIQAGHDPLRRPRGLRKVMEQEKRLSACVAAFFSLVIFPGEDGGP